MLDTPRTYCSTYIGKGNVCRRKRKKNEKEVIACDMDKRAGASGCSLNRVKRKLKTRVVDPKQSGEMAKEKMKTQITNSYGNVRV